MYRYKVIFTCKKRLDMNIVQADTPQEAVYKIRNCMPKDCCIQSVLLMDRGRWTACTIWE